MTREEFDQLKVGDKVVWLGSEHTVAGIDWPYILVPFHRPPGHSLVYYFSAELAKPPATPECEETP